MVAPAVQSEELRPLQADAQPGPPAQVAWWPANQRYLLGSLVPIRRALERIVGESGEAQADDLEQVEVAEARRQVVDATGGPPPLDYVFDVFGLSEFERGLLLLCAGIELDGRFASLCAAAQGGGNRGSATFHLAMSVLPDPEWGALIPDRPLRRWRLIRVAEGSPLMTAALEIEERVLHFLAGFDASERTVAGRLRPVDVSSAPLLIGSQDLLARRLVGAWTAAPSGAVMPILGLCGRDAASKQAVAANVCARLGRSLMAISAQDIPGGATELEDFLCLWGRESRLSNAALLVDCDEPDTSEAGHAAARRLLGRADWLALVMSRDEIRMDRRPVVSVEVRTGTAAEQRQLWQMYLGEAAAEQEPSIDALVAQFDLTAMEIEAACLEARGLALAEPVGSVAPADPGGRLGAVLWASCRHQARPAMSGLAQRIEGTAGWEELVVPALVREDLAHIATQARQRRRIADDWGFGAKSARGLGISALFAGPSGTGKTMAAEVLAGELGLDLFHVDLSEAVSKYIGETEKNLRRIFDAAGAGGSVLLFDEADALFGKRSDVKDSHDRYANIEVSYLLQRMEEYRGLSILTTNREEALDGAFLRRLRFVVRFPFPDAAQRAELWQQVFPAATPVDRVDVSRLAQLSVSGGSIRNIALNAAAFAASDGSPITMGHLRRAAQIEYRKWNRPLTEAETRGWA